MDDTRRRWLAANPFLVPLAHFHELVTGAAAGLTAPALDLPPFEAHAAALAGGVPLLRGPTHGLLLRTAGADLLGELLGRASRLKLPGPLAEGISELTGALSTPDALALALTWLVEGEGAAPPPPQPGLLRYLGWTAFGRALRPIVEGYAAWRDDAAWRRPTCPTCGALPVLARLVDGPPGRELACGCCATRWGFPRACCPYCGNQAAGRLASLVLPGPAALQLDVCEACQGYVKTCAGCTDEELFLEDWPTLALDAMAAERGYRRLGVSLFEL